MPQLDIIYVFMTYLWTWWVLHSVSQKIKTHPITSFTTMTPPSTPPPTTTLPWT